MVLHDTTLFDDSLTNRKLREKATRNAAAEAFSSAGDDEALEAEARAHALEAVNQHYRYYSRD